MEIQEDVKLELSDEAEADVSTGMRAATTTPRYTDDELKAGLGEEVSNRIDNLLSRFAVAPSGS
jgi:hypothetical protein